MRRSIPSSLGWMAQPPITFQSLKKAQSSTSVSSPSIFLSLSPFFTSSRHQLPPTWTPLFTPHSAPKVKSLFASWKEFFSSSTLWHFSCSLFHSFRGSSVASLRKFYSFSAPTQTVAHKNTKQKLFYSIFIRLTCTFIVCQCFMAGSILGVSLFLLFSSLFPNLSPLLPFALRMHVLSCCIYSSFSLLFSNSIRHLTLAQIGLAMQLDTLLSLLPLLLLVFTSMSMGERAKKTWSMLIFSSPMSQHKTLSLSLSLSPSLRTHWTSLLTILFLVSFPGRRLIGPLKSEWQTRNGARG